MWDILNFLARLEKSRNLLVDALMGSSLTLLIRMVLLWHSTKKAAECETETAIPSGSHATIQVSLSSLLLNDNAPAAACALTHSTVLPLND